MKDLTELKKVHDLLIVQTQKLASLLSPCVALEHGKPTPEQIATATADSVGLVCFALARIIEVINDTVEPQVFSSSQKDDEVQ
jgi:hypothetical protein